VSAKPWDPETGPSIGAPRHHLDDQPWKFGIPNTFNRSFLRWVGGKQYLIARLKNFVPTRVDQYHYVEPFAGAANLFFALKPRAATRRSITT
jgi:hypothetical protein